MCGRPHHGDHAGAEPNAERTADDTRDEPELDDHDRDAEVKKKRKTTEEIEAEIIARYNEVKQKRKADKADGKNAAKRPAAKAKAKAKGAAGDKRSPKAIRLWTGSKPSMPRLDEGPTDYKTGRIYVSNGKQSFRIIRTRGSYSTECSVKWKREKPVQAEWSKSLKSIDDYKGK